jgi:hypothetical protein
LRRFRPISDNNTERMTVVDVVSSLPTSGYIHKRTLKRYSRTTEGVHRPFSVGLYRSADTTFNATDDRLLDVVTITPPAASSSQGIGSLNKLALFARGRPNLLVVADPPIDRLPRGGILGRAKK